MLTNLRSLGSAFEFLVDLFKFQHQLKYVEESSNERRPGQMTRLERSLAKGLSRTFKNESTQAVGHFLQHMGNLMRIKINEEVSETSVLDNVC